MNATVVPEPSSLALCLGGGGLWLAARCRRRNGCAIKRTVPQA
ncbi:MAG: PEP-CTERM sorting domain-containing protein [Verrucomicrobia bacterium]|nr:PEP-CTERM sorting domain-containing protein [Verrucomicrobiota bacterium]